MKVGFERCEEIFFFHELSYCVSFLEFFKKIYVLLNLNKNFSSLLYVVGVTFYFREHSYKVVFKNHSIPSHSKYFERISMDENLILCRVMCKRNVKNGTLEKFFLITLMQRLEISAPLKMKN